MDNPTIHELIRLRYNRTTNTEFIAMVNGIIAKHVNLSHKPLKETA